VCPPKTVLPLSLSKASVRFLDTLPPKQYRQVTRKIIMLMANPQPTDAERLKGYEYSRVTAGEYRVIFDVRDGLLRIIAIGKRNDDEVYRRLR
jgi:mRNA interferase RelE/StbE